MTTKPSRSRKQVLAADVWRLIAEFAFSNFQRSTQASLMRELGLTPGHLKALAILDPDEPRPMRAMADALSCDASMVTWLVDRLEDRGLVERGMRPSDRRVKTVVLTPLGIATRARIQQAFYEPPQALLSLDTASLEAIRQGLAKLPASGHAPWGRPVPRESDGSQPPVETSGGRRLA